MSKEVNDKINISRELIKKQVFDGIILFIAFIIIFVCVKYFEYYSYDLISVLVITFIILLGLFSYSIHAVKLPLNNIIIKASEETKEEIIAIQEKNKTQMENNNISDNKIKSTIELVENLKQYSTTMTTLTNSIREKTNNSLDFTNDLNEDEEKSN